MSMMNPDDLDSNVAGIAALLYIIADLETTVRTIQVQNLRMDWFEDLNLAYKYYLFGYFLALKSCDRLD